jgi:hypothetical protein
MEHRLALYDDLRNDRLGGRVRLEQERVQRILQLGLRSCRATAGTRLVFARPRFRRDIRRSLEKWGGTQVMGSADHRFNVVLYTGPSQAPATNQDT